VLDTHELSSFTHFFKELVTNVSTSWFSSSNNIVPRYPNRLSANRGDARSLRHSICPKCVRSPSVKRYNSFATLLRLHDGLSAGNQLLISVDLPDVRVSALFSEACPNSSTLFLHNSPLIGNGLRSAYVANELLYCQQSTGGSREGQLWRPTGAHVGGLGPRNGPDLWLLPA